MQVELNQVLMAMETDPLNRLGSSFLRSTFRPIESSNGQVGHSNTSRLSGSYSGLFKVSSIPNLNEQTALRTAATQFAMKQESNNVATAAAAAAAAMITSCITDSEATVSSNRSLVVESVPSSLDHNLPASTTSVSLSSCDRDNCSPSLNAETDSINENVNSDDNSLSDEHKMINFSQISSLSSGFVTASVASDAKNYDSKPSCSLSKKSRQAKSVCTLMLTFDYN